MGLCLLVKNHQRKPEPKQRRRIPLLRTFGSDRDIFTSRQMDPLEKTSRRTN